MPEAPIPLEALLARLASSRTDEGAWRELYRQTWPFVFAVVYRRLRGSRALAEEATQEVFIRLVHACPFERLRNPEAFRRYVWRVADNFARSYARRVLGRYRTEVSTSEAEAGAMEIRHIGCVEGEVVADDLLQRIVADLPSGERKLLQLVLEGRSLSEIAEAIGLTYGNAAVRIHRLRHRVRNLLFTRESLPS